jgi:hypothetical protein
MYLPHNWEPTDSQKQEESLLRPIRRQGREVHATAVIDVNHRQHKKKLNIFVRCKTGETDSKFLRRASNYPSTSTSRALLASPWENQEKIMITNCSI